MLIIQPKFITGKIPLKTRELNPAIVVITTKKEGFAIDRTVLSAKLYCNSFGSCTWSSLYLTIRWTTSDIFIISCSEIKFEDTTVISQPKSPKNPLVVARDTVHIKSAITTHFTSLRSM